MKLGFIGLGNLGTPLAENLLSHTKQLYVFNRTATKMKPLIEKGAIPCKSVKELASLCDIVFSIVSDDGALKEISKGDEGIAANLKAEGIHVSISTILPETASELSLLHHQRNNHYLASPLMGRPEAARAGKLNFLISGEKQAIEKTKPFLNYAGASGIWEFGEEAGAANVAKLCSNFLIASAIEAMAEGIQLAKKSGIDATTWLGMLTQTLFNAPVYINYGNILLKEAFEPVGFSLKLGSKDMNLVMQQATSVNAKMPFGKTVQQQLNESLKSGLADHDWTTMALVLK